MLSNFQLAKFSFNLKAQEPVHLPPYKGSTFRGAFGYAFKKIVCALKKEECNNCLLKEKCIYSYVFETPVPKDSEKMRKYTQSPHPFIIEPPLENKRYYSPGETIIFNLILIGKTIDYLPYFIYTFIELGKRGIKKAEGRYLLEEVRDQKEKTIFNFSDSILTDSFAKLSFKDILPQNDDVNHKKNKNQLKITFLTPTRIKYNEQFTLDLEFHILIRNLLRRISLLSYFHCGEELDIDFKGLIEKATAIKTLSKTLTWHDWERYSNRQKTRMKLGGFIGEAVYEGDITPFLPFIKLGEFIHVGKGSSFGLGKYEIE